MDKSKWGVIVRYSEVDQGFVAICMKLPGLTAFGNSRVEALEEMEKVIELINETDLHDIPDLNEEWDPEKYQQFVSNYFE